MKPLVTLGICAGGFIFAMIVLGKIIWNEWTELNNNLDRYENKYGENEDIEQSAIREELLINERKREYYVEIV